MCLNNGVRAGSAHRLETAMTAVGAHKEIIESFPQHRRHRPHDFQSEITPTARHAVAAIFGAYVKAPDERYPLVDDEDFSVISVDNAIELEWIKPAKFTACFDEFIPVAGEQTQRSERIAH